MAANERDIDFDWIGTMLDTLLSGFIPGLGVRLADADRDGDGINEDDALALLSAVLRGGTRVPTSVISAADQEQIRADFVANRDAVHNDFHVYGERQLLFFRPADEFLRGQYGNERIPSVLTDVLGAHGGSLTRELLLDYMAGLVTIGNNTTSFTAINGDFIGKLIDALCASMENQDLAGLDNMWNLLRA